MELDWSFSMAVGVAAAAILRLRRLCHAKVPSMINPMNNAVHTTLIATLDLGLRRLRALLAGEVAAVPWPVGDSVTELGVDKVGFTLEAVFVGAAVIWMSAVGLAKSGVQLESPMKSIRDDVTLY